MYVFMYVCTLGSMITSFITSKIHNIIHKKSRSEKTYNLKIKYQNNSLIKAHSRNFCFLP